MFNFSDLFNIHELCSIEIYLERGGEVRLQQIFTESLVGIQNSVATRAHTHRERERERERDTHTHTHTYIYIYIYIYIYE